MSGVSSGDFLPLNLAERLKNCLENEENQSVSELIDIAQGLKNDAE